MSQVIKSTDPKLLQIITDDSEESARTMPINNPSPKILASSNGSLVRVMNDAGRLEFIPIVLTGGTITPGSQDTKTNDQLSFAENQEWILLSNHSYLNVEQSWQRKN